MKAEMRGFPSAGAIRGTTRRVVRQDRALCTATHDAVIEGDKQIDNLAFNDTEYRRTFPPLYSDLFFSLIICL